VSVDKARVARNFGRYVRFYEDHAIVQKRMAHQLLQRVHRAGGSHAGRIIEVGCGTGYFTQLLAETCRRSKITAIDICSEAVAVASLRLRHNPKLNFRVADGEELDERNCDLLVSNATFQWFNNLPGAFARYYACLRDGGALLFATLGQGTFKELYVSMNKTWGNRAHAIGANYKRHFPSPEAIESDLSAAGFTRVRVEHEKETEMYNSVKDFLYAIKHTGAGNPKPMVLSPRSLAKLISFYSEHFSVRGRIQATYAVIYGEAVKTVQGNTVRNYEW
jgi:malonyl-CoA O-methyltransferase